MSSPIRLWFRPLLKHPAFSAAAILTLALGIGANTAIFSVVHAILIRPFPYPASDEVTFVSASRRDQPESSFPLSFPDLEDFQQEKSGFTHLGGALDAQLIVSGEFAATRVKGAHVSPSVLELLRVPPRQGRLLRTEDDQPGAPRICVLGHRAWERFFALDPAVVGKTIVLDGKPHEVVGVMPPGFRFWDAWFYLPLAHGIPPEMRQVRGARMGMWGIGRLARGVTPEQAQQALDVVARRIEQAFPGENKGVTVKVRRLSETVGSRIRPALMLLFGAVACVLLIACVNVANLLLARGSSRTRELAVRSALGATRARIARDLIAENIPLGVLASLAGVAMAFLGLRALLAIIPGELIPAEASIRLSWPVLGFTLAVGILTAVLAAVLPAWHGARAAVADALKDGGRSGTGLSGTRIRASLIVAEVALALTLLIGAGLLLRSLAGIARTDPGFRADGLLVASIELPDTRYGDPDRAHAFLRELVERVARFPQARQIGIASTHPMSGGGFNLPIYIHGRPFDRENLESIQYNSVFPGTLETLGIQIIRGRHLEASDRAGGEPVVVINAAAARRFFPDEDPIGRRIIVGVPAVMAGDNPTGFMKALVDPPPARIVGIVQDTRQFALTAETEPEVYFPYDQSLLVPPARNNVSLVVRTSGDPRDLAGSIRQELRSMEPLLPLDRIRTMDAIISDSLRGQRFMVVLLGTFAATALLLSAIGIYSVVAWLVSQRTREMGIRLALGAQPSGVVRLIALQGLRPVLIGLALGAVLAVLLSRTLASQLVGITTTDPLTYVATALGLAVIAAVASWFPARRAARVDPLTALRAE